MTILKSLSFDDVLLVPNYSPIESRSNTSVKTKLGHLNFNIPIASANMDSITEVNMAVAITNLGGLGCIHRFMPIEQNCFYFHTYCNHRPLGLLDTSNDLLDVK